MNPPRPFVYTPVRTLVLFSLWTNLNQMWREASQGIHNFSLIPKISPPLPAVNAGPPAARAILFLFFIFCLLRTFLWARPQTHLMHLNILISTVLYFLINSVLHQHNYITAIFSKGRNVKILISELCSVEPNQALQGIVHGLAACDILEYNWNDPYETVFQARFETVHWSRTTSSPPDGRLDVDGSCSASVKIWQKKHKN